ncbi:MAG: hypothetical protein Q9214_000884 [Letrouitia sp. 1 TL-2023]
MPSKGTVPPKKPLVTQPGPRGIPSDLSFYVKFEHLEPNFKAQKNRITTENIRYWCPPNIRSAYHRPKANVKTFRWGGGRMGVMDLPRNAQPYQVSTVFTQYPDTTHLLPVGFDAEKKDVQTASPGGWKPLSFRHYPAAVSNRNGTYSSVETFGDRQQLAAPGSRDWIPQLLATVYDYSPTLDAHSEPIPPKTESAGLIGSLPILLAMAAFSAPESRLVQVMTGNIRPGRWIPHTHPSGRELLELFWEVGLWLIICRHPISRNGR